MNLIAIDPGASGGIATLTNGVVEALAMPETPTDVYEMLAGVVVKSHNTNGGQPFRAYMEKVGGFTGGAGQPGSAMFNFGRSVGIVEGILIGLQIPFELITPQRWQKSFQLGTRGTVRPPAGFVALEERKRIQKINADAKRDWKNKLKEHAQRLFPHISVTLKTADALLILEYARALNMVPPPRIPQQSLPL